MSQVKQSVSGEQPSQKDATASDSQAQCEQLHADVGTAFLEEMDQGQPHRSRIHQQYSDRSNLFTQDEKDKAFAQAAVIVKGYSDELVMRWSSEIDTYLVYAGLFSAILTAFNVESYQLLQPASPDPTSVVLQHISLQLSSLSYKPPLINSSYPAFRCRQC
ncbi:hypothetical protein C8Q70DRAFT_1088249 [Cubamyces menziesii]|nr:hypothetical protein C8Q70DRAFT_1088249 [Cubamyces menziesii]